MACTGPRVSLNQPAVRPSVRNSCTLRIAARILPHAERSEPPIPSSGKDSHAKSTGVGPSRVVCSNGISRGGQSLLSCVTTPRETPWKTLLSPLNLYAQPCKPACSHADNLRQFLRRSFPSSVTARGPCPPAFTIAGNGAGEAANIGGAGKPPASNDASQKEGLTGTPAGSGVESATSRFALPKPTLAVRNLVCILFLLVRHVYLSREDSHLAPSDSLQFLSSTTRTHPVFPGMTVDPSPLR